MILYGEVAPIIKGLESQINSLRDARDILSGKPNSDFVIELLDQEITNTQYLIYSYSYSMVSVAPVDLFDNYFSDGGEEAGIESMVKEYFHGK